MAVNAPPATSLSLASTPAAFGTFNSASSATV